MSSSGPLDEDETATLSTYNAERARGIVHTREWVLGMVPLQIRFDGSQPGGAEKLKQMLLDSIDAAIADIDEGGSDA